MRLYDSFFPLLFLAHCCVSTRFLNISPPAAGLPQGKVSSVCDPGQSGNWGYASELARMSVHTPKSRPFILINVVLTTTSAVREEKEGKKLSESRIIRKSTENRDLF